MFKDLFIQYLTFEKRYSKHTIRAYDVEVGKFQDYLETQKVSLTEVVFKDLRHYISLQVQSGRKENSVNLTISALRTFFHFLQREEVVKDNPLQYMKALKKPKKLPVVIDQANLNSLLDEISSSFDTLTWSQQRDLMVLEVLFGTGIRLSELLAIQESDLDFFNQQVLIHGKGNKERIMPLTDHLAKLLQKYLEVKRELGFESTFLILTNTGKPAYASLIYKIVNVYLSQISTQEKKSPHVMRHTFATSLLDNGADLNAIKELLGHANLAATQVYTHNSVERLKSIYKQAHPRA